MATKYVSVHVSPNGPGDSRPTALQIIQDQNLKGRLSGKVILITGSSSGLGLETANALSTTDATLYLTARNLEKAKTALGDLANSERVHLLELDLNSLESVRVCAKSFLSQSKTLNIFIANAGVMSTPEGRTKDGFETQFGTNHLAHFLLFNLLKDTLLSSSTTDFNSRAVILSSVAHRFAEPDFDNLNMDGAYDSGVAYGRSKTCDLWTANEIERRYGAKGLHAFSVHPGGIATNLMRHLSEEEKGPILKDEYLTKAFKSPEQGAATTVWGAVSKDLEGKGGRYLEDCQIARAWGPDDGLWGPGYATWAYDEVKEGRLWKKSLELVGLEDES